jgi:hypothetical protein
VHLRLRIRGLAARPFIDVLLASPPWQARREVEDEEGKTSHRSAPRTHARAKTPPPPLDLHVASAFHSLTSPPRPAREMEKHRDSRVVEAAPDPEVIEGCGGHRRHS